MYDELTDKAESIARDVDFMVRYGAGREKQFDRCRKAANDLAAVVYSFTDDPSGVGTDALREAWQTFMQQDAGNFSSDPEPALTRG